MHLDSESVITLGALRRADIEREIAGYRLARQAVTGRPAADVPAGGGSWQRSLPRWLVAMRGLVPGLARPTAL